MITANIKWFKRGMMDARMVAQLWREWRVARRARRQVGLYCRGKRRAYDECWERLNAVINAVNKRIDEGTPAPLDEEIRSGLIVAANIVAEMSRKEGGEG